MLQAVWRCYACRTPQLVAIRHLSTTSATTTLPQRPMKGDLTGAQAPLKTPRKSERTAVSNRQESVRARPDWKYLPDWRRQTLSIKQKLKHAAPHNHHSPQDDRVADAPANDGAWNPRKKLSPEAMTNIRALHANDPEFTVPRLADLFKVSPEAIRRILKSRWIPTAEEARKRDERWKARKSSIVQHWRTVGKIVT